MMKWKSCSISQRLAALILLFWIFGTPISCQVVKLRNLEKAPGAGYIIQTDSDGDASWGLDVGGAITVNLTPIGYVPSASGNANNNNEVVQDPNGNIWIIDGTGDAVQVSTEIDGSETEITAGANVSITGAGTIANPYVINSSGGGGGSITTYNAGSGALVTASGVGITFAKNTATGVYTFSIPDEVVLYEAVVDGDVADDDGNGELFVAFNYDGTRAFNQSLATAWRPHVWVWESGGSAPSRSAPKNIQPVTVQGISSIGNGDLELTLQNISTITPNPVFQFKF
jgi:hypothetical protein